MFHHNVIHCNTYIYVYNIVHIYNIIMKQDYSSYCFLPKSQISETNSAACKSEDEHPRVKSGKSTINRKGERFAKVLRMTRADTDTVVDDNDVVKRSGRVILAGLGTINSSQTFLNHVTIMCGADIRTVMVAMMVNRVKMIRHILSITIAANFQSFVIFVFSSSLFSWFVIICNDVD